MIKLLVTNEPLLLQSEFELVKLNHRFHYNYNEIDLALQYESHFTDFVMERISAYGIKKIGCPRFPKTMQSVIMERLNINHPKSFFNRQTNDPFRLIEEFDSYVDLDEVVVKPVLGARGIGVKKLTREEYKKCLQNYREIDEVFSEEKKYLRENDDLDDSSYIEDSFRSGMLVQEPINIKREFRVLCFAHSDLLVYERVKNPTEFCGNLSHGAEPKPVDKKLFERYIEPMIPTFNRLLTELNTPWLSIDLYVDQNDNIGVFEFQMEFAYSGFNYIDVRTAMIKSINYFIN